MSFLPRTPIAKVQSSPRSKDSHSKITAMSKVEIKDSDIAILIAAIQNSVGPLQVDAERVAKQLGMSLSTIPPKFTTLRKRYNIDIKVLNSGALQRNRTNTPKKAKSRTNLQSAKAAEAAEAVPWPEQALDGVRIDSPSPVKDENANSLC